MVIKKKVKKYSFSVIGCGNIGYKRAEAIRTFGKLISCYDKNLDQSKKFKKTFKCKIEAHWKSCLQDERIDIVIISTTHDSLLEILIEAIKYKKHVLIEKPLARTYDELIKNLPKKINSKIRVGFNHRYHPAIIKAKNLIKNNIIGDIIFLRARYGHGARPGYNKEWRFDPIKSGGGQLIDQGSHLIDLSSYFLGEVKLEKSLIENYFWKAKVDDNSFLVLKNKKNIRSYIHTSCTEWKNIFNFEIFGKIGKIEINGLGRSYGVETLKIYKMSKKMGKPKEKKFQFRSSKDNSWKLELSELIKDINYDRKVNPGIKEAKSNLLIIKMAYKESRFKL